MGSPATNAPRLLALIAIGLAAASAADAKNVATVNATQIFGTVDPAKINDYTEYMAGVNLYDGLTTLDGEGAIVPLLAESWEVSDDALTWTFTLRRAPRSRTARRSRRRTWPGPWTGCCRSTRDRRTSSKAY